MNTSDLEKQFAGMSIDQQKSQLQQMAQDYMNNPNQVNRLKAMVNQDKERRLSVNIDHLRSDYPLLAKFIIRDPIQALKIFQDQLNLTFKQIRSEKDQANLEKKGTSQFPTKSIVYYVNFEGNLGRNHVTPRGLKAQLVNQYVAVNGIVTRMSIVKPKIQTSVHYCEENKQGKIKQYQDHFNLNQIAETDGNIIESGNGFPTKDD